MPPKSCSLDGHGLPQVRFSSHMTVRRPLIGEGPLVFRTVKAQNGLMHHLAVPLQPLCPFGDRLVVGGQTALDLRPETSSGLLSRGLVAVTS